MAANKEHDAVDMILADHELVRSLFAEAKKADTGKMRALLEKSMQEISRHSVMEEQLLYPCVRLALDDGEKLADESIKQTIQVTKEMERIKAMDTEDKQFMPLCHKFMEDVEGHLALEEKELLPRFREVVADEDRMKMGALMQKLKPIEPNTPNSSMPTHPPENLDLALKYKTEILEYLELFKVKYGAALGKRKGGREEKKEEVPTEKKTRTAEATTGKVDEKIQTAQ